MRLKLQALAWFLQERRQWKKGQFIVLILMFDKNIKKRKSLWESLWQSDLSFSLAYSWVTRIIQHKLPLKSSLQRVPLVIPCLLSAGHLFISRHCFLFFFINRSSPSPFKEQQSRSASLSCSFLTWFFWLKRSSATLTRDKFKPSLFINRMKKTKTVV